MLSCVVAIILLMLPGALAARVLGCRGVGTIALAPLITCAVYGVLGCAYAIVGMPSGPVTLFAVPSVIFGAGAFVRSRIERGRAGAPAVGAHVRERAPRVHPLRERALTLFGHDISWAAFAASVAVIVGLVTCATVFLPSLGSPDAFSQNYDNAFHMSRVRTFMDTGVYSSLAGGFYPSAWHCLAALVGVTCQASVPMAISASMVAIEGVAYPLSMFVLLAALFPTRPRRVVLGCLACTMIAYFPWRIMLFGPLYPNVLSFSLMTAVAGVFVVLVDTETERPRRIRAAILFVIGGISLALAQPNGVFSAGVFLIPCCLVAAARWARAAGASRGLSVLAALGCALLIVAIWVALLCLPFFKPIVTYPRDTPVNWLQALKWAFHFSFVIKRPQFMAGFIVALGGLGLVVERRGRWVAFGYALTVALYVVAISFSGQLREALTGFWYNDYHRLAAAAAVFAIVPLSVGLDYVVGAIYAIARKLVCVKKAGALPRAAAVVCGLVACVVLAGMYVLNSRPVRFLPEQYKSYGYDAVMYEMRDMYGCGEHGETGPLDAPERAFLDRVADEVGHDAVIVNQPYDGSVFGYALDDLNLLFKQYNPPDDPAVAEICLHARELATDPAVRVAIDEVDAAYVLQLDQGAGPQDMNEKGSFYLNGYGKESWEGINLINDETPGFTPVLAEGDMRLYRVEAA